MSINRSSTRDGLYDDSLFRPRVKVAHSPLGLLRMTSDPQYLQLGPAALEWSMQSASWPLGRLSAPGVQDGDPEKQPGRAVSWPPGGALMMLALPIHQIPPGPTRADGVRQRSGAPVDSRITSERTSHVDGSTPAPSRPIPQGGG